MSTADQTPSMSPLPEPFGYHSGFANMKSPLAECHIRLTKTPRVDEGCTFALYGLDETLAYAQAVADERVREALAEVADLKKQVHDLNWALGTEGYDKMHDPQDQADHEEAVRGTERFIQRMEEAAERQAELERKAARYDWLRSGVRTRQGVPTSGHRTISRDPLRGLMEFNFWCTAEELDAAIDASLAELKGKP